MNFNSTKLTLANTMMIGVIMTVCSNNWMSMWMGLEMSLLSFIPFIYNSNKMSSESMMKYFIMQSVASTMFLFSVIWTLIGVNVSNEMILTIAMLIKLGLVPFHNWVIMIIETIDYLVILVLLTVLKIPPLSILNQISPSVLMIPITMSMIVSSFSCLNQSSVRKTLGFSSIYNISLMLTSINKFNIMVIFLSIYTMMMAMFTMLMNNSKINFINQMISNEFDPWLKINLWINMLSLGGFPPTMGFVSKLMIMQTLVFNTEILITSIFVLTSMLVMMFYTRLAFTSMMNFFSFKKWMINMNKSMLFSLTMNMSIVPMLMTLTSLS